ncbi:MAG: ABC transporter permease [Candidatus Rokubacteria bacterium]|nr:ABC transporter permease [Candidatus Rokubacteria bacterium]
MDLLDAARWHRWLRPVGAVLLPLASWELASRAVLNTALIPPPTVVALAASQMLQSGELFIHIGISLRRIFVGFALGSAIGIAVGMLSAWSRLVQDLVRPLLAVCSAVPPIALIPLAMAWFGIDETARLFLITYLAAVLMVPSTVSGVRNVAAIRIRAARSLGARPSQIYLRVVLPDAFPFILTGLRVTLGFCFMVVVAAEMIGANSGVGYLIMQSRYYAMTTKMFVGILLLGLMGVGFDALFRRLVAAGLPRFAVEKRTG